MPLQSAGLLVYRRRDGAFEVFLVHPGGPFFARKDMGVWSIPKGEFGDDEDPLGAAKREFEEETGMPVPTAPARSEGSPEHLRYAPLEWVRQHSGKIVHAWAVEGDLNASKVKSNVFPLEWPPHSGKHVMIPEVDRGAWFDITEARKRITEGQRPLLDELERLLSGTTAGFEHT